MTKDRYFVTEDENDLGLCLVLKGPWSDDFIDVIREENISVLRLSDSAGWRGNAISFLEKLRDSGLRGVGLYSWDIKDVSALSYLPNLEYISLACLFNKGPDFSRFKKLTHVFLTWRPAAKSIFGCRGLELLNIVNYPDEDLKNLSKMTALRRLQIMSRKLVSLTGIESLKALRFLDLAECTKLESLDGIGALSQLEHLEIETCKKISSVVEVFKIPGLKNLFLLNSGDIDTLRGLEKLSKLEKLIFYESTNILDGDLSPILKLRNLRSLAFQSRKHYSHKSDELRKILFG